MPRTLVWFRRDLRIADHAPLHRAAIRGEVIPVFIFDRALLHHPETAGARVAFMLNCLQALDQDLQSRGGRLILRYGDPVEVLPQLVRTTQAEGIYAYLDFERIYGRVRDARLNQALAAAQMKIRWFEPQGSVPELIPYPQYRDRWYHEMTADRVPIPSRVQVPDDIASEPLPTLTALSHQPDGKLIPPGGTQAARDLLRGFFSEKSDRYYWQLSYPSAEATTGLSPYIKFGAISVRECYQTTRQFSKSIEAKGNPKIQRSCNQLVSRLRWGSGFAQRFRYLPQLELRSLYSIFDHEGWDFNEDLYQAWQTGHTGFPIVDAAARCLQATGGWKELNFRTRAIYASFLSNLCGIDWRYGALHFMRHLIDGDCPIDHYQWAMQSGVTHCVDKSWTRIYNPEQSAIDRCDPQGLFIKRWIPELAGVPPACLGVPPRINGYPTPILQYKTARRQRVQRLDAQRANFRSQDNLLPHLARLPPDWTPFGSDRFPSEIAWAQSAGAQSAGEMFPAPLDLETLDLEAAQHLRTWFVAHINITPRQTQRRRPPKATDSGQLSLWDLEP